MIPALLFIAFHVAASPPAIFEDDFSSCEFDSNWIIFGDPAPEIVDSLGHPPPCFRNNGDGMWDSGAVSREIFDISRGLVIQCDMFMDCHERGTWVNAVFGIVTPDYRQERNDSDSWIALFSYRFQGELAWGRPHLQGILTCHCLQDAGSIFTAEEIHYNRLMGRWHRYRIEVGTDRVVNFFIDDSLCATVGLPLSDSLDSVRVLLGNRSSEWGLALHDNITVSIP